ncbi:MAG: divergent polysaccharide deacetylase family protein, partial [Beijerinckiaceae bacterium]
MSETAATANDLTRPLGAARRRTRRIIPAQTIFAVLSGMMLTVLAGQIWLGSRQDPNAPVIVEITRRMDAAAPAAATAAKPTETPAPAAGERKYAMSADEAEQAAGVKVFRGGGETAPGSLVITVPTSEPAEPKLNAAPDRRLTERSRHGVLPRIGP